MADAEDEFSADGVQKFLLANGGKATNVEVVGHFAKYLNNPEFKVLNRQKFKDYINEVATVKSEKGDKFLVLKNEYFYREWIEPKHVIIRSAQSQAPKPSWPPPAPEQPMEAEPVAPTRKKKKSHDHSSAHHQNGSSASGRSSPKPKSSSPRPTISAPIYTGPVDQHSVVSTRAGEKTIEELSQIEGVRDARDKFEQESMLQAPTPPKQPSSTTTTATTGDADAVPPPDIPPAPVEIQVTDDDKKEDEHIPMESNGSRRTEPEPPKETTPPPPSMPPAPTISQAVAEMQKPEDSPSVKTARKLFEKEAEKEAAAAAQLTSKLGGNRSPRSAKKLVQNGVSPAHHHHDDDDHIIGSDLTESQSSDTLRSIKSTSSGNSYPDTPAKLEPLERQWMMESAKGNVPVLMGLLEQEPGLVAKKDFITFSALHWGAKHGKKEMIRLVVDRGIDVNMRSQGGYTPLHVAAMHNKEAIMQFLVSEYHADINKRDFSGRKPRHYLQTSSSSYIKQMLHGKSTADVVQPHTLMALSEPKHEEKRHSKIGSLLRSSFRHSFRLWGSAENLEDKDHKRERTPPVTPPPSPMTRPKTSHAPHHSQSLLMPPPSGYMVTNRGRKVKSTSDKDRTDQLRKSESDPDMLMETTPTTYV